MTSQVFCACPDPGSVARGAPGPMGTEWWGIRRESHQGTQHADLIVFQNGKSDRVPAVWGLLVRAQSRCEPLGQPFHPSKIQRLVSTGGRGGRAAGTKNMQKS